jgi:glucose/arabinose dehydrogenase
MRKSFTSLLFTAFLNLSLYGCGDTATLPIEAGMGPDPRLPEPHPGFMPTVHVAAASGWSGGAKPTAAPGLAVNAFANSLDHPRWLYVLPNGDVLVAESNAPTRPERRKGITAWFMERVMTRAGAGVSSANRITLLRDSDGDGVAETRSAFLENLNSPFGMTLVRDNFYVANTDALVRYSYNEGDMKIDGPAVTITALPAGPINHHWTKNVIASEDGSLLYVTVGSNSNVGENGLEHEVNRAAILEVDPAANGLRLFASGLRNPNGLAWNPADGALWTAVNERDGIGSDLVPDYMTTVQDGGFYGWPYSYFGQHLDERVEPQEPDLVARALVPDYALGAHTASLGLAFYEADLLPPKFRGGAFVGQHGSWNRKPRSGYKVIFVPFDGARPSGMPENVLTGFLNDDGEAHGRPVGVVVDRTGALLVADDVGNVVWRVTPANEGAL